MNDIEKNTKILNNLKKYLNLLIIRGQHKIFYNDLGWDEKTIDCINAINYILQEKKKIIEIIDYSIEATGNSDVYTTGMSNGLIYIKSVITDTEPDYLECPKQDSIPVQKVKDKIEENNKIMIDTQNKYPGTYAMLDEWRNAKAQNDILEELLEDK